MQVGVATIGSNGSLLKKGAPVTFNSPFSSVPVVVATPLQGTNYPDPTISDTFAVTVTKVTTTGFTVNVYRVDGGTGWGQNLRLGWFAEAD